MKIKITENMIKGPYGKIDKLFKTPDGFITNGEWMIREEYIELPENHPEIKDIKKTSKEIMKPFGGNYTDDPDFKITINPCYGPIVEQFDNFDNIAATVQSKSSPLVFVDFKKQEMVGVLMPGLTDEDYKEYQEAKSKQQLMMLLNTPEKYVEKFNLIPVEFKLEGVEGVQGIFVEENATDEYIKRMIKFAVKQNGGRWLGKFERHPEKKEEMLKKIAAQMSKIDIAQKQKEIWDKWGKHTNGIHS